MGCFNIKSIEIWTGLMLVTWQLCICDNYRRDSLAKHSVLNKQFLNTTEQTKKIVLDRHYFEFNDLDYAISLTDAVEPDVDYKKRKRDVIYNLKDNNEIKTVLNFNNYTEPNDTEQVLVNNTKEVETKLDTNELNRVVALNITDKDEFGKLTTGEGDDSPTTEYLYENYTEPCVDDDDEEKYCNYTKEEYIKMLDDYIFPHAYEWVLIFIHAIVFIIGLVGNALVCIAVYRNQSMRTVTNYFIVNLAVADFMVILICLPPTVLWDVTETWFFGTAMCRIVLYLQSVSVTVSVLTLTFISVDRWYAICFPLKFQSTTGRAKTAIVIIWLLSLLFNIPEFVVLQVQKSTQLRFDVDYFMQCTPTWSNDSDLKWHVVKALFLYTFPLSLMTIAYYQIVRVLWRSDNIPGHTESHKLTTPTGQNNWSTTSRRIPSIHANASTEGQLRSRRKAAKMLVAVVAMFAVCYFPVHLLSVLRLVAVVPQTDVMTCIALFSHVLCYANSAVNPLIYNFMSGKFRREFHRSYFKCFCCCHTPSSPDRNGASFAPLGSSRAGTTRTIVRRNDSCVSYRLTHLSPSNHNSINRDYVRNTNTSFIEHVNGNRIPIRIRDDSLSESAARFTIATDVGRD